MNNKINAQIGLLFVTIIWGLTFIMVKEALEDASPFSFATLRFGLASLLTLIIVNKKILSLNKIELKGAIYCGFFLFSGYAFQNFGLLITTATKSAFITSVSVIVVPILLVLFRIQQIKLRVWIAVLIATFGLYLLIMPDGGINLGDIITFGCAISFAIHIILQDKFIKQNIRILPFFFIQLAFVTFLSYINAITFESDIIWSSKLMFAIIITGVFATFLALLIMIWAQKILTPYETAIIFSMEPVAAALFAMIFASEIIGFWGWVGGILICIAIIYSEKR